MFLPYFTKFYEKNCGARIKKGYETNHEFALALKMLPALASEKEEKIGKTYDKIVEEIQLVCNHTIKESEKLTTFALILDRTK